MACTDALQWRARRGITTYRQENLTLPPIKERPLSLRTHLPWHIRIGDDALCHGGRRKIPAGQRRRSCTSSCYLPDARWSSRHHTVALTEQPVGSLRQRTTAASLHVALSHREYLWPPPLLLTHRCKAPKMAATSHHQQPRPRQQRVSRNKRQMIKSQQQGRVMTRDPFRVVARCLRGIGWPRVALGSHLLRTASTHQIWLLPFPQPTAADRNVEPSPHNPAAAAAINHDASFLSTSWWATASSLSPSPCC